MAQQMPRTYWLHHSLVSGASLKASLQRSPTLGPLSIESRTEATWVHNKFPLSTSTIYFIVLKKSYNSHTSCIIISPHEVSLISNTECMCKKKIKNCLWAILTWAILLLGLPGPGGVGWDPLPLSEPLNFLFGLSSITLPLFPETGVSGYKNNSILTLVLPNSYFIHQIQSFV